MSTTQRGPADAGNTIRDFLANPPRRTREGRVVAGVAAGIGKRYGVDPVLIRVAIVVSAVFGGAGVLLYLLAWLTFAEETDEVSPAESLLGRGHSNTSRLLTLVLLVALVPATGFVFGGHYSTVVGALMILAAMYLLHRSRVDYRPPVREAAPVAGGPPVPPPDPMPGRPAAGARGPAEPATNRPDSEVGAMTDSTSTFGAQPYAPPGRTTPPTWDPLGAAPFAWDLPDPHPSPPPPPARRKPRVVLATVGAALVVLAVLAMLGVGAADPWVDSAHSAGVIIAVLGIGQVVGAFLRSGRGLIPLALVASVAGLGLSAHLNHSFPSGGGDAIFVPQSAGEVQPSYRTTVGTFRLDLTQLPRTAGTVVTTAIDTDAGDVTVIVPRDADVVATCGVDMGDVTCLGQRESGPGNPAVTASQNHNASVGAFKIVLTDVHANTGSVRVIDGD